jgi:hypothetical protein
MPRIESSTTPLCVQLIWSMRFSWWDAQVHRRRPYQPPVALAVPRLCRFAARASFVTSGQIFVLGCHGALPSRAAQRLVLASAGAGPSKTCNTSSRTATRDKQMPREILYCHATRQTRTVGAGHWFFHTGQWAVCAEAGKAKDGRWHVRLHFAPLGETLPQDVSFGSIGEVQRFVGDYFGTTVIKVNPNEFPDPTDL